MLFKMSSPSGVSSAPYGSGTSASEDRTIARYHVLLMSTVQFLLGLGAEQFITKHIVDYTADPGLLIVLTNAHYCTLGVKKKCRAPCCTLLSCPSTGF